MEEDFYGLQKQIWRLIQTQRKEVNELVETNHITNEKWIDYLSKLFRADNSDKRKHSNWNRGYRCGTPEAKEQKRRGAGWHPE